MNLYPSQYQLAPLAQHVISLLERRRAGMGDWSASVEEALRAETQAALDEAGRQFREVANDTEYWRRTTDAVFGVCLPRYFKLAKTQHGLEQRHYGMWRGGDLIARAAYAVFGLLLGFLILRTPIPDWLEFIPLALFVGGPLLPDAQVWFAKHRYAKQLSALVDDMQREAEDRQTYSPVGIDESVMGAQSDTKSNANAKVRDRG